jgi:DNA-binding response OmpR family regulator|tara:strand:- start:361 stop:468 length:108 start_codon:yes stop_codon:yes gene_type:complete
MLVYLAQNAGQLVSRGQILDAVLGYDADTQREDRA